MFTQQAGNYYFMNEATLSTPQVAPEPAPAPIPSAQSIVRERLGKTAAGQQLLAAMDKNKSDVSKIHTVDIGPSPIRASIGGDLQTVAAAEAMIDGYADVPATLKQFLKDELAELETNACELHLHLLDLPNGDVTVAVHIKGVQMGPKAKV